MRKVLWFCAGLIVLATVGVFLAADYVHHHPESMLGRAVVLAYQGGVASNALFRSAPPKPAATAQQDYQPTPDELEQVRQVVAETMRSELPPIQLLGTIVFPVETEATEDVIVFGEEISEIPVMEPLIVEVPLTMPHLHESIQAHGCTWDGWAHGFRVKGKCETTEADMIAIIGPCETTEAERGRLMTGRCETTDDEVIKGIPGGGEELSEPAEKEPELIRKPNARPGLKPKQGGAKLDLGREEEFKPTPPGFIPF